MPTNKFAEPLPSAAVPAEPGSPSTRVLPLLPALGVLALLAGGCPETLQQSCPTSTFTVGNYQLNFTAVDAGDFCAVTGLPDGGKTDASVASGRGQTPATLCSSAIDGGSVFLVIAGQNLRQSSLDPSGNFSFSTGNVHVTGTQCYCPIDEAETLSGLLLAPGDSGTVQFTADGGLTPVGSITGALVDQVTVSAGDDGGSCTCKLPCALRYSVTGTPL